MNMVELDSLIHVLNEGVELYSPESGSLLDLNERIYKMFGVNKEKVSKEGISIYINPIFPKKLKDACRKKKHIRIKFPYFFDKIRKCQYYESRYKRKELYLQCFGLLVVDGGVEKYMLIMDDITAQQKRNKRSSIPTKVVTERLKKFKTAFVENVTHEVRTPLNAIVGFSQLIGTAQTVEERNEYARIISDNADLLTDLVDNILELSEMETGYAKPDRQWMDFSVFFEDAIVQLKSVLDKSDVKLIFKNPYKSCEIFMDKARALQVTSYLVSRIIKYVQNGYIEIGYRCDEKGLYTYVKGTGIGLPEERCRTIISYFKKSDDFLQNIGVGFALCGAIVKGARGKFGMDLTENEGPCLWIWIPCKQTIVEK